MGTLLITTKMPLKFKIAAQIKYKQKISIKYLQSQLRIDPHYLVDAVILKGALIG